MKEKHIAVPGGEVVVRLGDHWANRIARTLPYKLAVKPALQMLRPRGVPAAAAPAPAPAAPVVPVYFPREPEFPDETPEQREIVAQIKDMKWYHTIDLGHGVRTPGEWDHIPALDYYPLPKDLTGKRCLDVATFDGFWAFEMEKRGAAEVVALDIESWLDLDLPPRIIEQFRQTGVSGATGASFKVAHKILNSKVDRRICNIYDLSPELFGQFDYVFCSDVLVHITNPLRAMMNIHSVTKGEAIFVETYLPGTAGHGSYIELFAKLEDCRWWLFGHDFMEKAATAAGFTDIQISPPVDVRVRYASQFAAERLILKGAHRQ